MQPFENKIACRLWRSRAAVDCRYEVCEECIFCLLAFFQLGFFELAVKSVIFKISTDKEEKAHIDIGYPDEGKE